MRCVGARGQHEVTLTFTFMAGPGREWDWRWPTIRWNEESGQLVIQFFRLSDTEDYREGK